MVLRERRARASAGRNENIRPLSQALRRPRPRARGRRASSAAARAVAVARRKRHIYHRRHRGGALTSWPSAAVSPRVTAGAREVASPLRSAARGNARERPRIASLRCACTHTPRTCAAGRSLRQRKRKRGPQQRARSGDSGEHRAAPPGAPAHLEAGLGNARHGREERPVGHVCVGGERREPAATKKASASMARAHVTWAARPIAGKT